MIYIADELMSMIRRLSVAQAADGERAFTGTVTLTFDATEDVYIGCEDPIWQSKDERLIDTRLIRDTPAHATYQLEQPAG